MLPPLSAERQLLAIEAALAPNMKPEALQRLSSRYQRRAARERPKSVAEQLMEHMNVVYEPVEEVKTDGG